MQATSNKYNSKSGVGEVLKLYEQKIYNLKPNLRLEFVDEQFRCLAKRVKLDLTQDKVYKTQFHNEQLAYAVKTLNEYTQVKYYNEDGEITNVMTFNPEISTDYASVVCQREPAKPLTAVSVVIYCGPEISDVLLRDGSIAMDDDYNPSKDQDIATKKYADSLIENFTAMGCPLESFIVKQADFAPVPGNCHLDNSHCDKILFMRSNKSSDMEACDLVVDPFTIPTTYDPKTTQIGLCVNGTTTHTAFISDIIAGNAIAWILESSENVYNDPRIPQVHWKNSFNYRFNLKDYLSKYVASYPYLDISIHVWDTSGHSKYSKTQKYGLDEYITGVNPAIDISYIEENLTKLKTKVVSGVKHFSDDESKVYKLPVTIEVENNFLNYFRPSKTLEFAVMDTAGNELYSKELRITSHLPKSGKFSFNETVEFNLKANVMCLRVYNLKDELICEHIQALPVEADTSDESNRVTTPSAKDTYPVADYGEAWDSNKELEEWEMKLHNGIYTSDSKQSAVCFVVKADDCYSHAKIDIEHDGRMFVLSEGNTEWLSCQKPAEAFKIPKKNNEGCSMNENYFTFGKVNYDKRLFIRIIEASTVKFNSVTLS